MNRLAKERSPYLRHSAEQGIDWYPWGQEAFDEAKKKDIPVFLSSGAIWCHWCHVMSKECFEDNEIIDILNSGFICIKLDRDERPDLDRRLQRVVQLMTGTSGWPLTVFLTPDGEPFFGGTYFPPDDRSGRPGLKRILRTVSDFYRDNRGKIKEYSSSLKENLVRLSDKTETHAKTVDHSVIHQARDVMLSSLDLENGGFGTAPKFPMPGAIGFLVNLSFFDRENGLLRKMVIKTLDGMARGGIYDHLGGGFHRYSTDESWIIPHFEKMADDNAMLLRIFTDAYSVFRIETFRDVAAGIIRFVRDVLSDPEGGFYASQDADVTPDDEGGYFTWRDEELKSLLDDEEYEIFKLYLWDERGRMHHDGSKRVLFISTGLEEIAGRLGLEEDYVREKISVAKEKLLGYRKARVSPFVDRSLYTSINGMMIASIVRAYRVFGDDDLKNLSIKALERIISLRFKEEGLYHSDGVEAMLDDYVYLIDGIIALYEITGLYSYIEMAERLMEECINRLYDHEGGGFYDTRAEVLGLRIKDMDDLPQPSPNSIAIKVLIKLFHITARGEYLDKALKSIHAFLPQAMASPGIHYGSFYDAVNMYLNTLSLSVNADAGSDLARTAISVFRPYTTIRYQSKKDMLFNIPGLSDRECLIPCHLKGCHEPIFETERLREFLLKMT